MFLYSLEPLRQANNAPAQTVLSTAHALRHGPLHRPELPAWTTHLEPPLELTPSSVAASPRSAPTPPATHNTKLATIRAAIPPTQPVHQAIAPAQPLVPPVSIGPQPLAQPLTPARQAAVPSPIPTPPAASATPVHITLQHQAPSLAHPATAQV